LEVLAITCLQGDHRSTGVNPVWCSWCPVDDPAFKK